jgi:hypothetical protein
MIQTNTVKRTTVTSRTPKNRIESPLDKTTKAHGDLSEKIAQKAYELYAARGYANGHDVEDWVQAEKIVKGS